MKTYALALGMIFYGLVGLHAQPVHVDNGPAAILGFAETAHITKITFEPHNFFVEFDKQNVWPSVHIPGWGDPNLSDAQKASCSLLGVDNGCIQYTLFPVINVNGEYYTTGALELWPGKNGTGGPFSDAARNWYYQAPTMAGHQPGPGERVGFMVVAGDFRLKDLRSVSERSSIAWVNVPDNDTGVFVFGAASNPPPTPTPVPQPPTNQPPDLTALTNRVTNLEMTVTILQQQIGQMDVRVSDAMSLLGRHDMQLAGVAADVDALKARPVPVSCAASINLGTRIPLSCKLGF